MPQEALSQGDIDRLLREMASGQATDPDGTSAEAPGGAQDAMMAPGVAARGTAMPENALPRRVRNYDFRRPNRIAKEYMRGLRLLHETFAREIPRCWGSLLRAGGLVKIASLEQTIYDEFRNHLAPHCFICTVIMPPLEGEIVFEIDLDAAFIIVDRLLGGTGAGLKRTRELTSLELSILQRVVAALLPIWRETWQPIIHLEPALNRTLSSTEFLQLTGVNESVVVTTFVAHYLGVEIEMIICIPYTVIAPILTRLIASPEHAGSFAGHDEQDRERVMRHMRSTKVQVAARLGSAPIPIADLSRLRVGDVIRLDVPAEGLATIHVGPRAYYRARPGLANGSLAVQVVDTLRSGS